MRLFSLKTGESRIKTIFTALKCTARYFSVAAKKTGAFSIRPLALLIILTVVAIQAAPVQSAPKEILETIGTTATTNIYPVNIVDTQWAGFEYVLSPDLSENALYQDFSKKNSAFVTDKDVMFPVPQAPKQVSDTPQVLPVDTATIDESVSTSSVPVPELLPAEEPVSTSSVSVPGLLPAEESTESVVEEITTEVIEEVFEPAATQEADVEPVAFKKATASVFAFFSTVTKIFPFTNAGATTSSAVPPEEVVDPIQSTVTELEDMVPTDEVLPQETVVVATTSVEEVVLPGVSEETTEDLEATSTDQTVIDESEAIPYEVLEQSHLISLGDFSTVPLETGQFIKNIQLRASLAGMYEPVASGTVPYVEFIARSASSTQTLGTVLLDGEISNAINGGYFLFGFPQYEDIQELENIVIDVLYHGDTKGLDGLYLDALWLEVTTETITREDLYARSMGTQVGNLKNPEFHEFVSQNRDFMREENPVFNLRYVSQRNKAVETVREFLGLKKVKVKKVAVVHNGAGEVGVIPEVTITKEGLVTVSIPDEQKVKMKPGEYSIELELYEGGVLVKDSFSFQWGVLAINTNKTEYKFNERVEVSMGALTPNGNTLCNAHLRLYVIDPRGGIDIVPVHESGQCYGNNVIDVPDYTSEILLDNSGEYELYLERLSDEGVVIGHTGMNFTAVLAQDLSIERVGPTRIFPPAPYPMELTVYSENGFSGVLTEQVPNTFAISAAGATVTAGDGVNELSWEVNLLAGMSKTFSYTFDAPDLSPYLYEVGPAYLKEVGNKKKQVLGASDSLTGTTTFENIIATTSSSTEKIKNTAAQASVTQVSQYAFEEHRQWQIASDATGNMILFWDDGVSIPTDWSCLSCGSGTFFQNFAVGSSTYNNTGGVANHTPTAVGSILASPDATIESGAGTVSIVSHAHTYTPTIAAASNLPLYRQLRVIQYTASAGEPPTLPAGAIGVFDATVPTGWTRYAAQDGYYIRGEDVPGTTGGSNTHTHTISGTTGGSAGGTARVRGGGTQATGASDPHTHTVNGATASVNNEPTYLEVILGKIDSTAVAPNGLISMWTDAVPSGWLDVSSTGADPFNNKYIKAATAYGATGGANTHVHSDVTGINTSVPSATISGRIGTAGAGGAHTHSVNVSGFSTDSNVPPYVSVVYGKRQGTDPVYEQFAYRWYTNENTQTPSDPWPTGASDLVENEPITATSTTVKTGDVVRLRLSAALSNATSTTGTFFKLQYAAADTCSSVGLWSDVGAAASSTIWRGFDNAAVVDGSTLSSTILAASTVPETYQEGGNTAATPNEIPVSDIGEWDFVLEQNGAAAGTNYCFRLAENDGTAFATYSVYPQVLTNKAPVAPTLSTLFDNEKINSTTPLFTFVTTDPESESLHYQIQIDDDYSFTSTFEDRNTISNAAQFENQVLPSDKAPFNSGQLIQFDPAGTLVNGTTYWYRVRAKDPDGSNEWGVWATPKSFTVDTTLTVSAWFQTTDDQFQTNSLSTATTTGSGSVDMASATTPDVSILDAFSTGNTKTISSGSGRLLVVGIHSGDSATNVNINTVSYGGQPLTEVYDQQIGGGFSNGMWVGYLEESGIQAAVGTTIVPTWTGGTPDVAVLYSSVVYENVDQLNPISAFSANAGSAVSTIQPTTTIAVAAGDMATYFTVDGTTGLTHTAAGGYTEGTEQDSGSIVAANAYKAISASGTEQPTASWSGSPNRLAIVALTVAKNTTGTMISSAFDFDDGTLGTAWGSLEWNDTETSGSISYQIQYLTDSATWALIPDGDLPGNSAGFGTSPVNLLDLSTDTYNQLRLVANFTYSGGSPSLQDWMVKWGYRVEIPTVTKLFPNEKVGTTTPLFEFTTTDPQSDDLTYQISWSTDNTFAASTTRTSDSALGFTNSDTGADTDPFNSGETVQFRMQGADALTNNTTYWYRVRAKDTTGDNAYSLWTEPQSFTVDTAVVVSTWFQTTAEQFDTDILSGTKSLATDVAAVATTAAEALIVYGEGTGSIPRYREWNGTVWGTEGSLATIDSPLSWARVKAGTTREEYVAVTVGTDADVNAQVFSTGAWSNLQEMTTSMGDINARGFDVAYETISGDALVAYCDGDADPSYYIWNGTSWTFGGTINLASVNNCAWIELASDPTSDEIIILARDIDGSAVGSYEAQVWNGATWGNSMTFGRIDEQQHEGMTLAYEESGNQALVLAANWKSANFNWNSWNGTTWGTVATEAIGNDFEWGTLVADEGSDELALCYQDEDTNIGYLRWTGSVWAGQGELLTTTGKAKTDPGFACAFENAGARDNYIMTAYTDTTATNYAFWNNTTWSAGAQINTMGDTITSQLERTGVGALLGVFFDETNDALLFSNWDGTSWSTTQTLENNASVDTTPYGRPYSIGARNAGKSGTTIVSPGIDFAAGVGPYWQEMSWVDTTPGTSDILYSVQYHNGTSWGFIPNADLAGNESGFTTSPIDLTGLNKTTYNLIRPHATLSCDGSNNCPTISDWTIKWAEGLTVSGTIQAYDQTTNINAGTVAVAVNGVLQSGKTGVIAGGAWSISNVTVFPGDVVTVFVTGATDAAEAVGVTIYDGVGNIDGLQLYERHIALGSNDATSTPLTNAAIGLYDVTNTEDVFFDVTGTVLTACDDVGCSDVEIFVEASTTYNPGGTVIAHDIENNGILVATSTLYVSGSWDNNATTTLSGSTVVMTATSTTESIDTSAAAVGSFGNLSFGTTTGAATWVLASTLDVNGDLTVTRGTLSRGGEAITVSGDLTNEANGFWTGVSTTTFDGAVGATWGDSNAILQNIGNVVIDGSGKIVTLSANVAAQSITVGADDTLDTSVSSYDITTYGDFINNNSFVARNGAVLFAATTTGQIITAGSDSFYDAQFIGVGGSWSFTESVLTVGNDFTVATGTVTMPTATTSIAGSFSSASGTFVHNNSLIDFTGGGTETVIASGTAFTNTFYDLTFSGSGSWTMLDQYATSSNDVLITGGTLVLPATEFSVGGSFLNTNGVVTTNSGSLTMSAAGSETLTLNGSSLYDLTMAGAGTVTFTESSAVVRNDMLVLTGTLVLPSDTLTVGGSWANNATVNPLTGTVLFNSADTGETINLGSSALYNMTFNSTLGGWSVVADATTTASTTLTSGTFTLDPGTVLSVGSVFTNTIGGASTTWTASTLSLENGAYSINSKTDGGDVYETLTVSATADVKMWHSDAAAVLVSAGGSLYSQDNAAVDGDLYIYGDYARITGGEYWSYATDFDGVALTATTSRQANVYFASGATATLTGVIFETAGIATASSTVANQGAGTYTITVQGGTTTAQYYDFADLGGSGLSLLAGVVVTSLDDGAFTVAAGGGSALTLSSTTIDANVAKQINRVEFATTTAIAATNVSQTDGAPISYWWFRNSTGNLDGEAKDNDTGDPGSVRWDDSSLVITIAGTVYSDAGTTAQAGGMCDDITNVITVVVENGASYNGSCSSADGSYSIGGVVVVGDPTLTVYVNGVASTYGAVITKTPTTDISDADIYLNRVIVRHEDISPMTIADMAVYDSSDDSDLRFTAATTTLADTLTTFAQTELFVWASSTFTPGGAVTLNADSNANVYDGSLYIAEDATFTAAGTTTYTVGGSYIQAAGASFIPASSTVVFTATTTGKTVTAAAAETVAFNEVRFVGTGGAWNINADLSLTGDVLVSAGTVTGTGDITLSNGSFYGDGLVSLGGGVTTIAKTNTLGGAQGWTFNDLTLGTGSVLGTTTPGSVATTTVGGVLTIATAHFLDAGASHWNLTGTGVVFVEDGTFVEDVSTFTYSGTNNMDVLSTEYYNLVLAAAGGAPTYTATGLGIQVFGDMQVGGAAATVFTLDTNDPAFNLEGDLLITANGTLIASDTGVYTLAGSYDNNGALTANSGTLTFDGTGTHTIAAGNSTFATVDILGTGAFTVTEHATSMTGFVLSENPSAFTLASGQTLSVTGAFTNNLGGAATTWTGSELYLFGGGNYLINPATTSDAYDVLHIGDATQIRMWNSVASTTTISGTGSLYSMDHNNVTGDLYVYGTYEHTSGTDHWSYATDFDGSDLSGGSERQADVYIQSGASVQYVDGGGLSVLGDAVASTTVQNQGVGTYAFTIGNSGSTTMNYYDLQDIDSDGLTFSGSPAVADLSYGSFLVANDADSAITVGGTAITANPARTFTNNIFATSSGVTSAVNVTATGTSVSSWRFTNHAGDVDGENYDVDPDGDPGYVVWDDSAASITIAGNVYSDEGSTASAVCDGSTANVHVRVAGLTSYTTTCASGTGSYAVSSVTYSPGDSIVVYLDGEAVYAATVTEDPISSINNMDLYEDRVIVRHEGADSLSIADMAVWDSSDDADIPFTAVTGGTDILTLPVDTKLIVWNGKEFEPAGDVTLSGGGAGAAHDGTLQLYANAVWTGNGSEEYAVGGSFILDAGASFVPANSTTTFTTTGAARTIDINESGFYNVRFTGSGSWSVTDTTLSANDIVLTAGTLTLPTGTTTISGAFNNNGGAFNNNGSTMVFDGTTADNLVRGDGSDFAKMQFTGSGSWTMSDTNATATNAVIISAGALTLPSGVFAVGGDFSNQGGAVTHNTSEIKLTSSSATVLYANGSDLAGIAFAGAGPYTMIDSSLTLTENLTVSAGSVTFASGTLAIGGSFDASGGVFDSATGTILFNSSDTGETVNPGASAFYNVVFGNASGGWTITGNATTTNNFTLSTASDFTMQSGSTLYVTNVFDNSVGGSATTWSGSTIVLNGGTNYSINTKGDVGDQYDTLRVTSGTDIEMWGSAATTTIVAADASLYSQDNASVDGALYIYGDYHIGTTTEYWSYATDFDGADLSGGSERTVTVYHAANATTTIDGGSLYITGASGNETTITNQGSGTYTFIVNDGTLSALYYAYRNLDSDGLQLLGTPTISSLTQGDYELAVDAGTLITLASSTLNANASMVISGVRFATTTAISGFNVTLTGVTSNAWTFVSHTGNLDGEEYDVDGGTACGSVRWSDSACLLTQQTHYRWRNDDGTAQAPDDEWYNASWNKRKRVRVENTDATTYTDAAVKLSVVYDADMQTDFGDLRFTDATGTTSLNYWIERYTASTDADVWVKVPTLAGSDIANIFMYYNNVVATTTSSSTQVFVVADDFEDGNISEYSAVNDDKSLFVVDGSFAYGGSYGLDNTGGETSRADDGGIYNTNVTVSQGEIIRYLEYIDTTNGDEVCTLFGVQSAQNNYAVCLEQVAGTDRISIAKNVTDTDTSGTVLASSTVAYSAGWYEIEIDWQTNDDIAVTLSKNGSVVTTVTANDATYTSGGIGFTYWYNSGGWDNYTSRPRVDTEPTIYFGSEQTDGGATWAAALDTAASGFNTGDIARLRLLVENSGLQVSNQTYQLEYAALGAAPSCEAVSGASYSAVPVQASCGTSPVCMQNSSNVTDGAASVDLLAEANGTFIAGEITEDPANTADALTINQDEYTELEYVVVPTINVVDQNLCFRATHSGTELDTYLRVAHLQLRFDPSLSSVSFNGGQNISLLPGTTTRVYASSTVTDLNGYTDIQFASSTMYTTSVGAACTADNNDCYITTEASQCSFTSCAGNSCVLECYADYLYHADATDADGANQWWAFLEVEDSAGGYDFGTSPSVEVNTLRALNVSSLIDYGALAPSSNTGAINASTTVENLGNDAIDVQIVGDDLADGYSSTIPADQQIFATSTFDYTACTACTALATTSINYEVDLSKPTTTAPPVTDEIFWGIAIPFGVASNPHTGNNIFYAIGDTSW